MFDLKRNFLLINAKLGIAVTIMVFTSACAHKLFVRPANNDSVGEELSQVTPEPSTPDQVSALTQDQNLNQPPAKKSRKHTVAKHAHKTRKKPVTLAHHKVKVHKAPIIAQVASVKAHSSNDNMTPPPPPPAPEIAMPSVPPPQATAAVQAASDESSSHLGQFVIYGMAALAILGLIFIAPRARRASKPKRKLVYNG